MSDQDVRELVARIGKLERDNRRLKLGTVSGPKFLERSLNEASHGLVQRLAKELDIKKLLR